VAIIPKSASTWSKPSFSHLSSLQPLSEISS
jgi:hypothetical protein